jgi:hypothetical protein
MFLATILYSLALRQPPAAEAAARPSSLDKIDARIERADHDAEVSSVIELQL